MQSTMQLGEREFDMSKKDYCPTDDCRDCEFYIPIVKDNGSSCKIEREEQND